MDRGVVSIVPCRKDLAVNTLDSVMIREGVHVRTSSVAANGSVDARCDWHEKVLANVVVLARSDCQRDIVLVV